MKMSKKPLAIALGAAFALTGMAAQASVFQASDLGAGYMVASAADAKVETKTETKTTTTTEKKTEAKCGEKGSNCDKSAGAKAGECMCGAAKGKKADGKCGEGKCGAKK